MLHSLEPRQIRAVCSLYVSQNVKHESSMAFVTIDSFKRITQNIDIVRDVQIRSTSIRFPRTSEKSSNRYIEVTLSYCARCLSLMDCYCTDCKVRRLHVSELLLLYLRQLCVSRHRDDDISVVLTAIQLKWMPKSLLSCNSRPPYLEQKTVLGGT